MAYPMGKTETTENQQQLLLEVRKNLKACLKALEDREIEMITQDLLNQAILDIEISLAMIDSERASATLAISDDVL